MCEVSEHRNGILVQLELTLRLHQEDQEGQDLIQSVLTVNGLLGGVFIDDCDIHIPDDVMDALREVDGWHG